ncbi:MAG: NCS2 family permease [Clostridia bacterium]|nr:NCS2 family permease [Clostridia bacterium]
MSEETKEEEVVSEPVATETPEPAETEGAEVTPKYKGFLGKVDNYFSITKRKSLFSTEVFAGLTTFLAMCYILVVNPNQILYAGTASNLWPSVFIATALGAVIGCLLMAFLAKMPLAQAPGMGVNAMIGGIIGGGVGAYAYHYSNGDPMAFSFGNAMLITLISGVLFLLLTVIPCGRDKKTGKLIGIREKIFEGVPEAIRIAIPVGIGLFIAFIGMQNAGLIVTNGYTQVGLVDFTNWGSQLVQWGSPASWDAAKTAIVALVSLFSIAILSHYKVKGSVIIGIIIATLVAMPLGVVDFNTITGKGDISWKFWENFKNFFSMKEEEGGSFLAAFTSGFNFPANTAFTIIVLVISFCMLDMFDTMGTVLGCCSKAGLLDGNGKPINFTRTMLSDSIATCTGALLGTSTVTTFVESGTGIAAGGKTGFTALTVSGMFLLSIFLLPIFAFIPSSAAAGALMYVGVLMMGSVVKIDFKNLKVAVPAFITIVMMPLAYSITGGIGLGIISYVLISIICYIVDIIKYAVVSKKGGEAVKPKWEVSIVTAVITVFFLIYFFVPTTI